MGMTIPELEHYMRQSRIYAVTSLDLPVGKESDVLLVEMVPGKSLCVQKLLELEEQHASIRQALSQLSEQEQAIINGYYFAQQSLRSIARKLDVTDSRIYQIRNMALRKLGAILTENAE